MIVVLNEQNIFNNMIQQTNNIKSYQKITTHFKGRKENTYKKAINILMILANFKNQANAVINVKVKMVSNNNYVAYGDCIKLNNKV